MPLHKKFIKTKIDGKNVSEFIKINKKFYRFLKNFDFILKCDPFWDIQRRILKYNLTISRSIN